MANRQRHVRTLLGLGIAFIGLSAWIALPGNSSIPARAAALTVEPVATGDQAKAALSQASPTADSSINLFVRAVEVVQAAQDRVNASAGPYVGVSLVAEKRTVVRIHPDVTGAVSPMAVTAELHVFRGGVELPDSPLKPTSLSVTVDPADDFFDRRRDAAKTFNFLLPYAWTTGGAITLRATINLGGVIAEIPGGGSDNTLTVTDVIFTPVPDFKIKAVPLSISGAQPSSEALFGTFSFVRMTYPVPRVSISEEETLVITPAAGGCAGVLGELEKAFTVADPSGSTFIYGVMPFGLDASGCARIPARHAVGHSVLQNRGWIAAQEIGHTLLLGHAGTDHGEGGAIDPSPYFHGGFGVLFEGRGPEGAGFVPARMLVIPAVGPYLGFAECKVGGDEICRDASPPVFPEHAHDFMSYGEGPVWVSTKTYEHLFDQIMAFPISVPPSTDNLRNYLVVDGLLHGDDSLELRPFYQVKAPTGTADEPGHGPLVLELQDASGRGLFTRRFETKQPQHVETPVERFIEVVPFDSRTARIVIGREMATTFRELGTVTVSANVPQVTVLSPNGGENWGGSGNRTIRWIATDADRDRLHYAVQYSTDEGATWEPLGIDLLGTRRRPGTELRSLTVDPGRLAGSDAALIRVIATDGVNTGADESNGSFGVANKPPLASILAPQPGAISSTDPNIPPVVFPQGMLLPLEGDATDMEESELRDSAFSWFSDQDGALGTGRRIDARNLSSGTHLITLTVVDSDGQVATESTTVVITPTQPRPPRRQPDGP